MIKTNTHDLKNRKTFCGYSTLEAFFKTVPILTAEARIAIDQFVDETCKIKPNDEPLHAFTSLKKIKKFPWPYNDVEICDCIRFVLDGNDATLLEWVTRYLEVVADNGCKMEGVIRHFDTGETDVYFFGGKYNHLGSMSLGCFYVD